MSISNKFLCANRIVPVCILLIGHLWLAACVTQNEPVDEKKAPDSLSIPKSSGEAEQLSGRIKKSGEGDAGPGLRVAATDLVKPATASPMGLESFCCDFDFRMPSEPVDRENYADLTENPLRLVAEHPISTFSIDVDTGSYSNVRRFLNEGRLPPKDAVRVEELINYFDFDYVAPKNFKTPFSMNIETAQSPWNPRRKLLQIGIKGFESPSAARPAANLVFLIDVSGSMNDRNKLPLLRRSMQLLTRQLRANDRVSLVVYAGASGVVLNPTAGDQHATILAALAQLSAGGSTNGAGGIRLAYQLAEQSFIRDGINRVLLATDGDFNVGTVDFDALIDIVERKRDLGVSLTVLGFGTGNYNDHLLEQLADSGDGNYAYIDNLNEGRKVLVEELASTLQTIAKDVKIQVEFNPAVVAEYRLIGYENRILRREDFNNDKIDAGEIGAGHSVTALYELSLVDSSARLIDPLRYASENTVPADHSDELGYVRLRYKAPDGASSRLIQESVPNEQHSFAEASENLRFAASVAAFGQLLRGGDYLGSFSYEDTAALASAARGLDSHGYRGEFLSLISLADTLAMENERRQAGR
jgi:Ca-activated chloride channel family protein